MPYLIRKKQPESQACDLNWLCLFLAKSRNVLSKAGKHEGGHSLLD